MKLKENFTRFLKAVQKSTTNELKQILKQYRSKVQIFWEGHKHLKKYSVLSIKRTPCYLTILKFFPTLMTLNLPCLLNHCLIYPVG